MSITRKIAHNTIIQFAGKAVSVFIGVISIAIMARYLGQVGFGQYSTIVAYLQIFAILVDLGLQITVVRLISDPRFDQQEIFNNVLTLRFISALIFLGIAPLIILFFPYANIVKIGVAITSLSFFFNALNMIFIGLFQKKLKMDRVTISEIAGRIIMLGFVVLFVFLDYGLLSIMAAVVLGSLLNFIINYLFALKFVKIKLAFDGEIWRKIIIYSWPIAISIAFNLIYFKADTIIISLFRDQADVGIYSAPYRVLEMLVNFIYMFMGIVFPVLTLTWAEKNFKKFKKMFQQTFNFLVIVSVPMIFGTIFVAKDLMILIAGQDFADSGLVLQIIIFATAIIFINSIFGYTVVVINKQRQMVWAYVLVAIISLIGYFILIPLYGYIGAAIFTVVSEMLILIFNSIMVIKTTKYFPKLLIFVKTIIASVIMSIYLYFFQDQHVILQLIIAALIYFLAIYLFKGFTKEFIVDLLKPRSPSKIIK